MARGGAAGGQRVVLSGVADLAGAGGSARRRQQGARVSAGLGLERGPHRGAQHQHHRLHLQVRPCVL